MVAIGQRYIQTQVPAAAARDAQRIWKYKKKSKKVSETFEFIATGGQESRILNKVSELRKPCPSTRDIRPHFEAMDLQIGGNIQFLLFPDSNK